ncbi:MAG: hypothetical protein JWL71_1535 [Acidobacteria bacterium]|nr:hypothetical protein [Acidobacteriota bacterium]
MPVLRAIVAAIVCVLLTGSSATAAEAGARVHGVVADESGGVLPGVTVAATARDGQVLATGVTDEVGRFSLRLEQPVPVRLTFSLEGFAPASVDITAAANTDVTVQPQRLMLAHAAETVVVRGEARAAASAPPPPPLVVPPPPRFVLRPVADHDRNSICGPTKPGVTPESFGTIQSGRSSRGNALYGEGDELSIAGGTTTGIAVGENFVARRPYRTSRGPDAAAGEHSAGLVQIVAAGDGAAVAVVVYACDELMPGDWLAAFHPEPIRQPEPRGAPAYDRAARILLTDAGQLIGAPRRLMVIDQGRDNGVRVGERLTLFRPARAGARRPSVIGDAVVVAVGADSATIRVEHAIDVIAIGDSAAPQLVGSDP